MPEYYRVDSRKITLREYWNILPSWKVLIPWVAGWFNVPIRFGSGFRKPETVRELEVIESQFPSAAGDKLQPVLEHCLQLGFHSPRFFSFENLRRDTRTSFIALLHRSGELTLRLMHTIATNVHPPVQTVLLVLMSELTDGTLFFTSDQKAKFRSRPGTLDHRLVGAPPAKLLESHQKKLAALHLRNPPRLIQSVASLDDAWDRHEQSSMEFNLQRGLYMRMSPQEVESEQKVQETADALVAGGVEHADVLVELNQLQNKKAGWGNAIWIFVVSMVLFVGAGSQQWSWKYALMLVPILFFHELGHYAAMRAFNYRNLRMFFLPFFGAAVAGRHYNVPGWKKVIVSMMGPIPGIVLGAIIGGAGVILPQPLLIQIALVMLILNGINLLPVLPLDGGWIFHALFFSRHPLLDAAFRVLAVIALALGGIFSRDKILIYVSIPVLLGVSAAYRSARITADLRKRGLPPGSPDDQTIPTTTAQAIIGELKKVLPKGHSNTMVAQQTLQIFENLNAEPPRWLATSGLLFTYGASLSMAVVFAGLCIVGKGGDFRALLAPNAHEPKRPLECGRTQSSRTGQGPGLFEAPAINIIGNFSSRAVAARTFAGLTNQLPSSAVLTKFGDSLILTLPAGEPDLRKRWFSELRRLTKDLFVDNTNSPASLSISCHLANEQAAKELENDLKQYFSAEVMRSLIPPWHPGDSRSAEQRAAHQLARKTYLETQRTSGEDFTNPRMRVFQKRFIEAQREGDDAEMKSVTQQMSELEEALTKERLSKLKARGKDAIDPVVIDLVSAIAPINRTNRDVRTRTLQQIAQRMGQLPLISGRVTPGEDRFSTQRGFIYSKGPTLHLSWLSFKRLSAGGPALIEWLCGKGCTDFKYDIRPSNGFDSEEEQ